MNFRIRPPKAVWLPLAAAFSLFAMLEIAGWTAGLWRARSASVVETEDESRLKDEAFKSRNASLSKKIQAYAPKGLYILIDTGRNILYLKRGNEVVRQAVISTGSGFILKDPNGDRKWIFDTPRGEYQVRSKATDPNWVKPDWAFIEEGEPIPKNYDDRIEEGMLGEYALGFGDGYFIHGTLYTVMLGRSVTHGCVRVGDEDLEYIYRHAPLGTKILIF
jgi:lipoprotein-anchoring transpeptidase ErfK/SrfK